MTASQTLRIELPAELSDRLTSIETLLQRLTQDGPCVAITPEYLHSSQLGALFGLGARQTNLYIAGALSAGALRSFKPALPHGGTGRPLYNVADFRQYLSRESALA